MGQSERSVLQLGWAVIVLAVACTAGCKKPIPKEQFDEMASWSTAICACKEKPTAADAKGCAAKLTKPKLLEKDWDLNHTRESVGQYSAVQMTGEGCESAIALRK